MLSSIFAQRPVTLHVGNLVAHLIFEQSTKINKKWLITFIENRSDVNKRETNA